MTPTPDTTPAAVDEYYAAPKHGWTCFHCGETFTVPGAARAHFGFDPSCDPACIIKVGAERGLVMALRRAEKDAADMRSALHNESTDSAKAYYAQNTRHREQLMATEELGYERGLTDGRAEAAALREALREIEALEIDWRLSTAENMRAASDIARDALKETSDGL